MDSEWVDFIGLGYNHFIFTHNSNDMIKANELRIGNWVELFTDKTVGIEIQKVYNINGHSVNGGAFDEIEPIPLTPEILEQCGFKQSKNHHSEFFIKTNIGNNSLMIKLGYKFKHENNWWPEVKYVHQLQNLYFALTGEEIKVNLNVAVNQ